VILCETRRLRKGGHDPAKTKAELISYLKDSFDDSNRDLATHTANHALDRVEGRNAGLNTKLGYRSHCSLAHYPTTADNQHRVPTLERQKPQLMTEKYGLKVR
jgi:hypothetical protein